MIGDKESAACTFLWPLGCFAFFRAKIRNCSWIHATNTKKLRQQLELHEGIQTEYLPQLRSISHYQSCQPCKPVNPKDHGCLSGLSPWGSLQAHDEINHQSSVPNAAGFRVKRLVFAVLEPLMSAFVFFLMKHTKSKRKKAKLRDFCILLLGNVFELWLKIHQDFSMRSPSCCSTILIFSWNPDVRTSKRKVTVSFED